MTPQEWIKIPYDWGAIRVYIYPAGANLMSFFRIFRANIRNSGFAVHYVARSLIVIASLSGLSTTANAADDTFACLTEMTGPLTELRGTTKYLENSWYYLEDGARFDARGAVFLAQTAPLLPDGSYIDYPLDIRSDLSRVCWAGAVVNFTNDMDITWRESKDHNSAAIIGYNTHLTVDGIRIHNAHDAIRPFWTRDGVDVFWNIRNSWITYNRDDCIENDWYAGGLVEDSLFDGCYVFLSTRGGTKPSQNIVTIRNSLIRMQKMPGPYGHDDEPDLMAHGDIFKTNEYAPGLVLENNIFLVEGYGVTKSDPSLWPAQSFYSLSLGRDKLKSCKNNIIVWLGEGEYPGDIPADPACVTVTKDRTVWDNKRAKWIASHPLVMRIDGVDEAAPQQDTALDPAPEPEPLPILDPEPILEPEPVLEPEPDVTLDPALDSDTGTTAPDTQDPSLTIISPVKGATAFPATSIWIEVDVSDNVGIDRLEVHIDRNSPMVFAGGGTHGFSWVVPESWGGNRHSAKFVAYDLAGNRVSRRHRFRMPN